MKKVILFGAGKFSKIAIQIIGKSKIEYIVDSNPDKSGTFVCDVPVYSYNEKKDELKIEASNLVIAVSEKYESEIIDQLNKDGIKVTATISELRIKDIKSSTEKSVMHLQIYDKTVNWIKSNFIENKGIIVSSESKISYPEVTGYYICSLLKWGYRDEAIGFAKWLIAIQKNDGSWTEPSGKDSYVFDTAQILKGLIDIRNILPEVDSNIIRGCDWILSNINDDGRLVTPTNKLWGDKNTCSELVHLYCLSPLVDAAKIFNKSEYREAAYKVLNYYKVNFENEIKHFGLLSHFYAYVVEGLLDLGEVEWVKECMNNIGKYQSKNGAVPAYNNVDWICSTGVFQLSLIWYRIGDIMRGNAAFDYACKLQNASGGWFGSYLSPNNLNEKNSYFPNAEISWAAKYFLDALYYKNMTEFDEMASHFMESIDLNDGRYKHIESIVEKEMALGDGICILDIGCGKGRYLRNLVKSFPDNHYFAVDLSSKVMEYFDDLNITEKKQGTLTDIPFEDNKFDVVYTCEALEHAVDIRSAVRELCRVTKSGGTIAILDKNKDKLGCLEIEEWEQWFDENELKEELLKYCTDVQVIKDISYENHSADGMFYLWVGIKSNVIC